jgi:hypothetical protein
MRKVLLIGLFSGLGFMWSDSASAQETYNFSIGGDAATRTSLVGQIDLGRQQANTDICRRFSGPPNNLSDTCTQPQACVAAGVVGGASCTAPDALAAGVRIYPNTLGGRQSFIAENLVKAKCVDFTSEQIRREKLVQVSCSTATQAQQNAICAAYNALNPIVPATGCFLCQ